VPASRVARWVVLLLPATCLALGFFARSLASRALAAFTRYETPFGAEREAPAAPVVPAGPALTGRVVMILVDGLGVAASRELPFLNELRQRGADVDAGIGLPSLSLPGRAVLLSGAWSEIHGQATNYNPRPLRVEHIFALARRAGHQTALASGDTAHTLFRPHVAEFVRYPEEPAEATFDLYRAAARDQLAKARGLLQSSAAPFTFVELHFVDEAGHGWGGASDEYKEAARTSDDAIRELASLLDLSQTTLVVTADHGHVPEGGHGGPEEPVMTVPLVLAGRGVRPGAHLRAAQADVAPTLAALLGLPLPSSNQGTPLLEALVLPPEQRVALLRATLRPRQAFLARYAGRLRTAGESETPADADPPPSPADPDRAMSEAEIQDALAQLDRRLAEAKARRQALDATVRSRRSLLLVSVPLVLCVAAFALGPFRARDLLVALLTALAGVLAYYALLPALGLSYSLTAVNKDEWLPWFFQKDMGLGLATCALATLAAAWLGVRAGGSAFEAAALAWLTTAIYIFSFVLKVAFVYWRHGVVLRWHMPEQYWSFGFYLDVLVVMAVGFAAPLLGGLGFVAHRVARGRAARSDT
jgi:hypothetical protein